MIQSQLKDCNNSHTLNIVDKLDNIKQNLQDSIESELHNSFETIENKLENRFKKVETNLNQGIITIENKCEDRFKSIESELKQNLQSIFNKFDAIEQKLKRLVPGPNFKRIGSKYYYFEHDKKVDWVDARRNCQNMFGRLATFDSEKEFNDVRAQLKNEDYWIGLNDLEVEGQFRTVDDLVPLFTRWHRWEPSDGWSNEDCGQLKYFERQHLMNDRDCSTKCRFICEAL